jgi:hypothetical protein
MLRAGCQGVPGPGSARTLDLVDRSCRDRRMGCPILGLNSVSARLCRLHRVASGYVLDPHPSAGNSWLSRRRAAIIGALLLGALPLWALPLAAAGRSGFLAYLQLSHVYYGGVRKLFGASLFPAHEFGIVPNGAAGLLLAATVYGVLGAATGWALAAGVMGRRKPLMKS